MTAKTPFHQGFKSRPVLVIAQADSHDYVCLPISRVTKQHNIDPHYDIKVDPVSYPKLNLNYVSYVRTHKQTSVHSGSFVNAVADMRTEYSDLYLTILERREEFSESVTEQALG